MEAAVSGSLKLISVIVSGVLLLFLDRVTVLHNWEQMLVLVKLTLAKTNTCLKLSNYMCQLNGPIAAYE